MVAAAAVVAAARAAAVVAAARAAAVVAAVAPTSMVREDADRAVLDTADLADASRGPVPALAAVVSLPVLALPPEDVVEL